jgi:hypothetical protein
MDVWWQSLETVGKRVQLARQLRHVELHYLRRTILFAEDFFGVLRDRVVVSLCFGCGTGSVDDVSASEAFSAVANAASPLIKSAQASS